MSDPRAIVIPEDAGPLCEIEISNTGVVIASRSEGDPLPRYPVARDSRGRMYTPTYTLGEVAVWSRDGVFLHIVGRHGEGPGELSGQVEPLIGPGDTLFVRVGVRPWSLFDPSGAFVRRTTIDYGLTRLVHFVEDGTVLSSFSSPASMADQKYFGVFDTNGNLIRSFGDLDGEEQNPVASVIRRTSGYAGNNTFWVEGVAGSSRGYVLEEWDAVTGEHRRTIYRNAPWYPELTPDSPTERPQIGGIYADGTGLIWVYVVVIESLGPPVVVDVHFDVIDPDKRMLVASDFLNDFTIGDGGTMIMPTWFPLSREGYWMKLRDDLTPQIDVVKYELHPAQGQGTCP